MNRNVSQTVQLGDLIVAAFDEAAQLSTNSLEVSRLATRAVTHMLQVARRGAARKASTRPSLPVTGSPFSSSR